ncbi:MAG: right-handed parallel beta-helix repeat-containing protein, partial [Actinobacteria bacterium]|nr:right-handed parallel beta-helix repeat-containing protein [Actinomycetota bacterium]
ANDNWWGAADGPGGSGSGSGDEISASVTATTYLTTGSDWSYFDAGPNTSEGTIAAPTVVQGTDTSEWGTTSSTRMLYDLESVILEYGSVDSETEYELLVTYYNPDNTTAVGGNKQSLADGDGALIHGTLTPPATVPLQTRHRLSPASFDTDVLELNFVRENGYRAVVSELWLVERADLTNETAPSASITAPAAGAVLTGGVVDVGGTTADTGGTGIQFVEVGVDDGGATTWSPATVLRADGTWLYRWTLPEDGAYTLYARACDLAGNVGAASSRVAVTVDQTAPAAATSLSIYDTPSDTGGSITVTWALSADDGGGADDVVGYDIERSPSGAGTFTLAGSVAAGAGTFADTTATNGVEYDYLVVTEDLAGNRADSAAYGPAIAIANDGSDTTAPADVTALSATVGNEFVYLTWVRSTNLDLDVYRQRLDLSVDGGTTWGTNDPDYDDGLFTDLGKEKNNHLATGLDNGTGYQFRIRVEDSSGNVSAGATTATQTPSATAVTSVTGTISSNTTWAAGVIRVTGNVTVAAGVTLTINPGVIVKLESTRFLQVNGTLLALGTDASPIVFTAWTDDDYGGDSNGNGASSGTPGYWNRIYFNNSDASVLEHVLVRYAGSSSVNGSLDISESDLAVRDSTITAGSRNGIYLINCAPEIEGNTITDHTLAGIQAQAYFAACAPIFRNNTVSENDGHGVQALGTAASVSALFDGNTIADNGGHGIHYDHGAAMPEPVDNVITGNAVGLRIPFAGIPRAAAGNTLAPNDADRMEVTGSTLARDLTVEAGVYWLVSGVATVSTGVRLTIEPGAIWKMGTGTGLTVNGGCYAVGTAGDRVVFTSYRDDSVAGDTNGGGASSGAPGDWGRIYFAPSAIGFLCRLENVDVRFGGGSGSVYLDNVAVPLDGCEI